MSSDAKQSEILSLGENKARNIIDSNTYSRNTTEERGVVVEESKVDVNIPTSKAQNNTTSSISTSVSPPTKASLNKTPTSKTTVNKTGNVKSKGKTPKKGTGAGSSKKKPTSEMDIFSSMFGGAGGGFGDMGMGGMGDTNDLDLSDLSALFGMGGTPSSSSSSSGPSSSLSSSKKTNTTPLASNDSLVSSAEKTEQPPKSFRERLSGWVDSYEGFVAESSWYAPFVESLKSMTLFLPGRFSPDGVGAQSIFTALSLLTHYHEIVTTGVPSGESGTNVNVAGFPQNAAEPLPPIVRRLNSVMFVISSTQCLMEMVSLFAFNQTHREEHDALLRRTPGTYFRAIEERKYVVKQSTFRWKVIFAIELLKFIIRMILLYANRGKILTPPPPSDSMIHRLQRLASTYTRLESKSIKA